MTNFTGSNSNCIKKWVFWWGMGIFRYFYQLCRIVQVFIYKQGDKKEVAKEGVFFVTAATPDTSPNQKEILD